MLFAAAVEKNLWRTTQDRHYHILPSVIVQVAEGGSASGYGSSAAGIHALEVAIVIHRQQRQLPIVKRRIDLFDVVQNMALRDEKVLPAIVAKIFQANSPARASTREHTQAGLETGITERAIAFVMVDAIDFTGKFSHDHV